MQFFSFTPQEIRALVFLLTALLIGSGITLYQRSHPQFAPELIVEKNLPSVNFERRKTDSPNVEPEKRKVNINVASSAELELLPGLGPVLSQRIVEYRKTKGPFQKVEDLKQVPGIGSKKFDQIKDLVTVDYKIEGISR